MTKPPQRMLAPEVRFLGEQDGSPEMLLKDSLRHLFQNTHSVTKAYLLRIDFGPATSATVALCVKSEPAWQSELVKLTGQIFASLFNTRQHQDTTFLLKD